jgi:glutathione S-transferase
VVHPLELASAMPEISQFNIANCASTWSQSHLLNRTQKKFTHALYLSGAEFTAADIYFLSRTTQTVVLKLPHVAPRRQPCVAQNNARNSP